MKNTGKKIGLFGGTFDPVHIGHLIIAGSVSEVKGLDTVIFIPSACPPHKGRDILFNADERFRMLSLAIKDDPRFEVSDNELKRPGSSYTIDTIREMKSQFPSGTELFFIVGMDNLYEIELWKDPLDIVREIRILAAKRVSDKTRDIPGWLLKNVEIVNVPLIEISSSDIRKRISEGKSILYLVPDEVYKEIQNLKFKI